ncbi:hypothetical protein, partial [Tropicibacter alexandrii]|uniref:hypothetical protein n=1 Tax=Tropicibacter alexandrii TaxID=2267683 RepID=UPI00197F1D9E
MTGVQPFPVGGEPSLRMSLRDASQLDAVSRKSLSWEETTQPQVLMDLSRFRAAPGARLGHFSLESDGAFP